MPLIGLGIYFLGSDRVGAANNYITSLYEAIKKIELKENINIEINFFIPNLDWEMWGTHMQDKLKKIVDLDSRFITIKLNNRDMFAQENFKKEKNYINIIVNAWSYDCDIGGGTGINDIFNNWSNSNTNNLFLPFGYLVCPIKTNSFESINLEIIEYNNILGEEIAKEKLEDKDTGEEIPKEKLENKDTKKTDKNYRLKIFYIGIGTIFFSIFLYILNKNNLIAKNLTNPMFNKIIQ